jgi:putative MFS transporter
MTATVYAGARLDRLPVGSFHRRMLWLVGLGMFFDSFDNTLSGAVLAQLLSSGWSTLQLNSLFMSATFVGLTIGAAFAGWLSDRYGRLFAYQFNLLIFGVMAIASAFAPAMEWLIPIRFVMGIGMGDVPLDVANGQALLINDYAASPVPARAPSLVTVAECAA